MQDMDFGRINSTVLKIDRRYSTIFFSLDLRDVRKYKKLQIFAQSFHEIKKRITNFKR